MFKVYVDRLKNGQVEKIDLTASPDFMEMAEEELSFSDPIKISGEAYITDGQLMIHLQVHTQAHLPCAVCNEQFELPIDISNFYFTLPIDELKSPVFDFAAPLREDILLQVPQFAECSGGKCPSRPDLSKYLSKHKTDEQHPFAGL
jgi:uncharacterized metal-binding protein YceD (DUF177 family)